jgi:hypothetical protein
MTRNSGLLVLMLIHCFAVAQEPIDPTRPQNAVTTMPDAQQNAGLQVSAIFIRNQTKQAIINNKSYVEGQVIQGFTLIKIAKNTVELRGPEGKKILHVNNINVKKVASDDF